MATYKEIKGVTIQTLDSDPVVNVGTWSSGGALTTGRRGLAGAGTQTAGLGFGGYGPDSPPPGITGKTEEYNGTSWSEDGDLSTARMVLGGTGTQTAGLGFGGYAAVPSAGRVGVTESYNGSSWSETGDLSTVRSMLAGCGTTTAGLAFGGSLPPGGVSNSTEEFGGSSWTAGGNMNTARRYLSGFGIQTAALAVAGAEPSASDKVEQYDGSSWTEIAEVNTARRELSGSGTTTAGLAFAGGPPATGATEQWNGTTWTEVNDLGTARYRGAGAVPAPSTTTLAFGGTAGGNVANTEEFSFPPPTAAILTEGDIFLSGGTSLKGFQKGSGVPTGSFSSGGALNTARYVLGVCGVSTAALAAGGDFYVGPPNSPSDRSGVDSEVYNGSTWTEVADMNNDVQGTYSASGTSTAAITNANTDSPKSFIESWNGSAWTNAPDINSPRADASIPATGSQTATLLAGGYHNPSSPKSSDLVEQYNGSSWSEITEINSGRYANRNVGTSTDNLVFGGYTSTYVGNTESWNGTTWTELNDLPVGRTNHAGFGGSSLAVTVNGNGPNSLGAPNPTGANSSKAINFWNGTSWSADADDAPYKARGSGAGGSATDGIVCGGIGDPNFTLTTTIEWNVDAVLGTITVS